MRKRYLAGPKNKMGINEYDIGVEYSDNLYKMFDFDDELKKYILDFKINLITHCRKWLSSKVKMKTY